MSEAAPTGIIARAKQAVENRRNIHNEVAFLNASQRLVSAVNGDTLMLPLLRGTELRTYQQLLRHDQRNIEGESQVLVTGRIELEDGIEVVVDTRGIENKSRWKIDRYVIKSEKTIIYLDKYYRVTGARYGTKTTSGTSFEGWSEDFLAIPEYIQTLKDMSRILNRTAAIIEEVRTQKDRSTVKSYT